MSAEFFWKPDKTRTRSIGSLRARADSPHPFALVPTVMTRLVAESCVVISARSLAGCRATSHHAAVSVDGQRVG